MRSFKLGDYERVRSVWNACGFQVRPGDDLQGVRQKLERDPELFLVAEERGKVVGAAMGAWDGRRGWIYHLGVDPTRQREGVATRLVQEMESRMRRKGIPKVNALIYPWNEASVRFFASVGYRVEDMKEAQKSLEP